MIQQCHWIADPRKVGSKFDPAHLGSALSNCCWQDQAKLVMTTVQSSQLIAVSDKLQKALQAPWFGRHCSSQDKLAKHVGVIAAMHKHMTSLSLI
jgi:hypothetical protein